MRSTAAEAAGFSVIVFSMSSPMKTMKLKLRDENGHGDLKGFVQNVCQAARDSSVNAQERGDFGKDETAAVTSECMSRVDNVFERTCERKESEWLERYERPRQPWSLDHWRPGVGRHVLSLKRIPYSSAMTQQRDDRNKQKTVLT
eukprot:6180047-Pleurochrysis_carterae.AAC.1